MNQFPLPGYKRLRFKNPPIVEAVLAFNVAILPETVIGALEKSSDVMIGLGYGEMEQVWQHKLQIKIDRATSSQGENEAFQLGWKFRGNDGLHAVQFNRTGIVFSRLGQYESWEQFRDQAKVLWNTYTSFIGAPQITSIGVRYINKLFIPVNEPAENYVTVWPHLPEGIDQRIENMQMRLWLRVPAPEGLLLHTQLMLPPEKDGYAALLYDNDFQFGTSELNEAGVWNLLEEVRDVKDYYFERFTTEEMRKTFDA